MSIFQAPGRFKRNGSQPCLRGPEQGFKRQLSTPVRLLREFRELSGFVFCDCGRGRVSWAILVSPCHPGDTSLQISILKALILISFFRGMQPSPWHNLKATATVWVTGAWVQAKAAGVRARGGRVDKNFWKYFKLPISFNRSQLYSEQAHAHRFFVLLAISFQFLAHLHRVSTKKLHFSPPGRKAKVNLFCGHPVDFLNS